MAGFERPGLELHIAVEVAHHMVGLGAPSNLAVEGVLRKAVAIHMMVVQEVRRTMVVGGFDCSRLEEDMESGIEEDTLQSSH
jgi:hypothetical protein